MSLGAVILCGGESKRMGRPKAWLTFGGERMLQRVVRLVANVVDDVAVVAAPGQELPSLPPSIILRGTRSPGEARFRAWRRVSAPCRTGSNWPMRPRRTCRSSNRDGSRNSRA